MAWNAGLIEHTDRGLYRAAKSGAREQFFWSGLKTPERRSFTLWLEPVITIGGLGRLHFDHRWPREQIGCQSNDYAFDLVTYLPDTSTIYIAGEVKKTDGEIDVLLALMSRFGLDPDAPYPSAGKERNASKKVTSLRTGHAPVFWALGPNGRSEVFQVHYDGPIIRFEPLDETALSFPLTSG